MGKQKVSVNSDESDNDNENADIASEDVSEEEEPSEENPLEEDPDEDEQQEVNSCDDPDEDPCVPSEDNLCEQELDGVASCEEEPNEIDSCGSPGEEECTGERNEESFEEEQYEECEQCEEEPTEEEPCEGPEDKQCEEEPTEEPSEEEPDEEEPEEELSEDSEEESGEGSPAHQSYNKNDEKAARSNSEKMKISPNMACDPKRISEISGVNNSSTNVTVPVNLGTTVSAGKKRQSKWDVKDEANEQAEGDGNVATKRRKSRWSRWSNDDFQTSLGSSLKHPIVEIDLEIPKLNAQLLDINKKLQSGVLDDRPRTERSPSPPPIYNNLGIKINTREARVRSKLMIQKQAIISELIKKNPNFKPPLDYKSSKFIKKIFVPSKAYPGYNFVGLILGPCGNTQKKMQKETGARIRLRGRGSKMDMHARPDRCNNEDLHVFIEADNEFSLDAAVAMVEKLLIPVDDGHNEHKLSQLRELAEIKGNLKANYTSNSKKPDACNVCGETSHPTSSCPLIAPTPGASSNGQKVNFAVMGGGLSPSNAEPPLSVCTMPSMNNLTLHACTVCGDTSHPTSFCPLIVPTPGANSNGQKVNFTVMGSGLSPSNPQPPLPVWTTPSMNNSTLHASWRKKGINDANLFVGCLPQSMDDGTLTELFSHFGPLSKVKVIRDKITNISKGYGFVMYADHISAAKAVAQLNGVKIDGKVLTVQIAGILPPSHINQLPSYPGPSVIAQNNPRPMCWPGPPESMLPETVASLSNSRSYPVNRSPFSGQYSGSFGPSFQTPVPSPFLGNFGTSHELAQFPGYLKSLDSPPSLHHQATPSNSLSSSQVHFTDDFGNYQTPPT